MDSLLQERGDTRQRDAQVHSESQPEPLAAAVGRLTQSVQSLEQRVSTLEQARPGRIAVAQSNTPAAVSPVAGTLAMPQDVGVFSIAGKAMLGIAGAYLLRAMAESTALPHAPVVALALVYAFLWLVPATRAKTWLPSLAWAGTSAIILLPMLWELTLRFTYLPASLAAGILAAYVVAAFALAWKHHFAEVAWMTEAAASLTAVTLALATRRFPPFLGALLLMAAVGEVAAARHRTLRVRPLVAAAADFVVFALVWIYSSPVASPAEYPPIGAGLLLGFAPVLLLIYAGSASTQTLLLGRRISFFETAQTLTAFLLAAWGVLVFWSGPGARVLGILCLAAAAAGYAVAFAGFERAPMQRNFHVYATGSLVLLLAGCCLSLSGAPLALALSALGIAATVSGVRTAHRTLQFHGMACLFVAAVASGLLAWTLQTLAGRLPTAPTWSVLLLSTIAMACYSAVAREADETWSPRALRLLSAALSLGAAAALLVWALVRLAVGAAPGAEHLALTRTVAGCILALLLAWSGARQQRRELVWLAWASLAGLAGKLLFEDLRHGHLGFTAAAIFVYAVTLLAVPRLVRAKMSAAHPR